MKLQGARILVIDDEGEMMSQLQRAFTAHEYRAFTISSVANPLEAISQYRPDLLLLGLDGSGGAGLEICQQVRVQPSLPIIVVFRNGRECDKVRAPYIEYSRIHRMVWHI